MLAVELVSVLALLLGGSALMHGAGLRGWAVPALGFLTGLALFTTVGLLQVVLLLPTTPVIALAVTAVAPAVWWTVRWLRGAVPRFSPVWALLTAGAVALLVAALQPSHLVNWSRDSYWYVEIGRLLERGLYREFITPELVTERLIGTPYVHSLAGLADGYYLLSVGVLTALATLVALVWFVRNGVAAAWSRDVAVLAALAVVLLVTMNRFVYHAFYINGHLVVGGLILVVAGSGWLLSRGDAVPTRALMVAQALAVPAVVVTRPEGAAMVGLALLPTLLTGTIPARYRAGLLAVLGGSVVAWQLFSLQVYVRDGVPVPPAITGQIALGVLAVAVLAPLLLWREVARHRGRVLIGVEILLWVALLGFAVRDVTVLRDSVKATVRNTVFGEAGWGVSLVLVALLVLVLALFARAPHLVWLRFPVTVFVPFALLLAYVREAAAYRVGHGDSLSRMLMHVLPLAIVYLLAHFADLGRAQASGVRKASGAERRTEALGPQVAVSESQPS